MLIDRCKYKTLKGLESADAIQQKVLAKIIVYLYYVKNLNKYKYDIISIFAIKHILDGKKYLSII